MLGGRRGRRMVAALCAALAFIGVAGGAVDAKPKASSKPRDPVAEVRRKVVAAIGEAKPRARSVVVAVETRGVVVDLDGSRAVAPASTQKLFTAGAALLSLPADHRWRTLVEVTLPTIDGVMAGDLVLVGGGDPVLTGNDLGALAQQVAASGIRTVEGALFVDDTRYDRVRDAPGWKPNWVPAQSGPLSSVAVDRNVWRRDVEFVRDPARANGDRFRVLLSELGVTILGPTTIGRPDAGAAQVVAVHDSPTLADVVRPMMKHSDNFVSEMLLKELGVVNGAGTTASGVEEMWEVADRLTVPRGQAADGSGLSAYDAATAAGEVRWLMAVGSLSVGPILRDSLPIGCVDGTLRTRFCRSAGAGRVQAKTGSLNGVTTLSGYAVTSTGHRVWFAMLLSGLDSIAKGRNAIDKAVNAVVGSQL